MIRAAVGETGPQLLVQLAIAVMLGATNPSETELLQLHHRALFSAAASDSTAHRALAALDATALDKLAKARRQVRRQV